MVHRSGHFKYSVLKLPTFLVRNFFIVVKFEDIKSKFKKVRDPHSIKTVIEDTQYSKIIVIIFSARILIGQR